MSACKKDKIEQDTLPFAWIKIDNKLTYNYYSSTDTTLNALTLTIIINPGNTNLRFQFSYPQWSFIPNSKWVGNDYNVFRKPDGLYTSTYVGCGMGSGFGPRMYFIRAPLSPITDLYYPDYLCKDEIYTAYKVEYINKSINVPLGNFETYVLQDTMTMTKEYWNEKTGIIMFELFDTTGMLTGQYKLASKNY